MIKKKTSFILKKSGIFFVSTAGKPYIRDPKTHHKSTYLTIDHTYDAVIVGAGGAGLRAALGLVEKGIA
jgi:heterodisulfide reductase subunit A-like polyferredoxin